MVSGESATQKKNSLQGTQSHEHYLLLALSRAAQSIQWARTAEDFYLAVGREINLLGGEVTLSLLNEDKKTLSIVYASFSHALIQKAEKMTGLVLHEYKIPIRPGSVYDRALKGEEAVFVDNSTEIIAEILPKALRSFVAPLMALLNLRQGILAPLRVDKQALGLLKVNGSFLGQDDVSAMSSFAGHIAAGLHNVRLMQKLQDELTSHRQMEVILNHNRNLLLALSRAAHAIQLVREPEGIYKVVGEQIRALGFEATILKFGSDKKSLHYQYTTIPEKVIRAAEKLAGMKAEDFSWAISQDSVYARVLANRRAEYISNGKSLFIEALPDFMLPLAGKLIDMLSTHQGILAPLHVDDETFGIMLVFGSELLSEEDLPAVESFSAQVAVSLRNALLTQRVEKELQERRAAEEAWRLSQSTFEGIFNSVTETIYIQDENGIFLDVNLGAEKMYGYSREHFIGRSPEFLSAPGRNDFEKIIRYVQQAFHGQPAKFEFWGIKRDGTVFPKDVWLTPGTYFGRQVVIAVARDITERKSAEEEQLASEAKIEALLNSVPDMMFVLNREGRFIDYHARHENFLYTSPAFFLERNIRDVLPAKVVEDYYSTLGRVLETGNSQLFEYSLEVDGQKRDFEAHIVTYQGDYVLNIARDITERKRAEEAVRQAEKRFKTLIENAPDGITLVGQDGKLKYVSPAVRSMFDYDEVDYVSYSPLEFIHPDDMELVVEKMYQLIQNPSFTPTLQYRYKNKDGSYLWVESTFSNQFAEPGVEAIVINFRDITERKQVEEALKHQNKNLNSLYQITAALGELVVIDDIYDVALESLQNALGVSRVSILLFDADGIMRFKAWRELSDEYRKAAEGHSPWKQGAIDPQPVLVPDVQKDDGLAFLQKLFEKEGIGALGFIPLVHQGNLLGKFMIYFDHAHNFLDNEIQLAQTIARHVAFAINRKRIEDALRMSEERYRTLYEYNPSMYFTADENGMVLSVNQYGLDQLGFSFEELVEKPIFNIFHPEDQGFARHQIIACLRDPERMIQLEARKLRKDGTLMWVRESARAVRNADGRFVILVVCNDVTEEINAQEALARSEAELRALFSSMQDTVLVIDRNGVYRSIAPTAPQTYYIAPEKVVGKNLAAFFRKEKVAEFLAAIEHVLKTGETVQVDYEVILDERSLWFETSISPMGKDTTIWVARDITERKEIESALVKSEQAFRGLFENMPIGLYRSTADGKMLEANPALLRMFGFKDARSMLEKKAWEFYRDPEANDLFEKQIVESGSLVSYEAEFIREDGTTFWAEDYVRVVHDEYGVSQYYEGSLIDITDRKQAELRIKESEQRYRLLAESVADVVWVLDLTTRTLKYVSPSAQRLVGYSADELIGEGLEKVVAPASLAEIEVIIPRRIQCFLDGDDTASAETYQLDHIRKDGSIVSVEVSSTVVANEKGELEAVGVTRDITQRKQAEDDLRRANFSLQTAHRELKQMFEYEQVLARTDGLTRLYNRRYFFELAAREFAVSTRYKRPLTIILFDVDGFKPANDTFGHAMGDQILAQISQMAKMYVREVDILARYGGDEFTILLPETHAGQASLIAERIRNHVEMAPIETGNASLSVTLSLGVAEILFEPADQSIEDVIRRADQALYKAKQRGRNHTVIYSDD